MFRIRTFYPNIDKSADRLKSRALMHEIRDARGAIDAADRDARKLRRTLRLLEQREARAAARLATDRTQSPQQSRQTVKAIIAERRAAARRLRQLDKTVADKRKKLERLRGQAQRLDKALVKLREGLQEPVRQAAMLTAEQLCGARAMLGLSQQALAGNLGIAVSKLRRLEKQTGTLQASPDLLRKVLKTLRQCGVELIPDGLYVGAGGPGLRLKRRATRIRKELDPLRSRSTKAMKTGRKAVA